MIQPVMDPADYDAASAHTEKHRSLITAYDMDYEDGVLGNITNYKDIAKEDREDYDLGHFDGSEERRSR